MSGEHGSVVLPDPSLAGLAERVKQFAGHVEDMGEDERVFVLGLFAGAVDRLRARLREVYAQNDRDGYMEALPPLGALAKALGDDGFEARAEGLNG